MSAYNPEQDKIIAELLEGMTSPTEEIRVRIRRYDAPDGTPGKTDKLEVSRWRVLRAGVRKPKTGIRLNRDEAAAVLAALLGLDIRDVKIDDAWNATILRGKSESPPGATGNSPSSHRALNPDK